MSVEFIGDLTREKFLKPKSNICKYMPLEYALSSLKKKKIWLSSPSEWKDPYERRFTENPYSNDLQSPLKGRVFCTCFTGLITSEAHWIIYSRNSIGICFRINRAKFIEYLDNLSQKFYIGEVKYQKTETIKGKLSDNPFLLNFDFKNEISHLKLLLLKRTAYSYEKEIRIFMIDDNDQANKGIELSFDWTEIISEIRIDPRTSWYTLNLLKEKLKTFGIDNVLKSYVYSMKVNECIEL